MKRIIPRNAGRQPTAYPDDAGTSGLGKTCVDIFLPSATPPFMADNTFIVSFVDKDHDPVRIKADSVQESETSYLFLNNENIVATIPRNVVLAVIEESSLQES